MREPHDFNRRSVSEKEKAMKLSEWAKLHNLQYQTVWRWFKNGQLPVKAKQMPSGQIIIEDDETDMEETEEKKEFSISPADIEVFKKILQEANADKEIKIITHRDVVIQEDHSGALEKKIDKLMEEVLYIKLILQSKEDKVDTSKLKEDIEKSFVLTETADKLEKSALLQKEAAEKAKEELLKSIKKTQKEKTEKLNRKEKAKRNGKSVGFARADQFKIDELLKIGTDIIEKRMKYTAGTAGTIYNIPFNDMSTMQKIIDKVVDSEEETNDEQTVLFDKCCKWLDEQKDLVKKGVENTVTLSEEEVNMMTKNIEENETRSVPAALKICSKYLIEKYSNKDATSLTKEDLEEKLPPTIEKIEKDMKTELTIAATENIVKDAATDMLSEEEALEEMNKMAERLDNITDNEPNTDVSRAVKIRRSKSS